MIRRVCCLLFVAAAIAVDHTYAASVGSKIVKRETDEGAPQEQPTLPPICALVSCFVEPPVCGAGEKLEIPEGECCLRCVPDCRFLQCDIPQCPFGQIPKVLKGDCCPSCAPDCSAVLCARPICRPGEVLETPEGQCCPRCRPDCSAVPCPLLRCLPGNILVTPEGQCCPECHSDCSAVTCLRPVCGPGQILETPEGECCPKCVADCTVVRCGLFPTCEDGQIAVTPEGECCPRCEPDCTAVLCLKPVCEAGQRLETPKGECCPRCVPGPDCSTIRCAIPLCADDEVLVTPEGECCPICQPDCSAVLCLRPVCDEGEEIFVPDGQCCPRCRPIQCEMEGAVFSQCARCSGTCDRPLVTCPIECTPGCTCPSGQVIDTANDRCVPLDRCPQNSCPIKGQTSSPCAGCDSTCNEIINGNPRRCIAVCRPGCSCPPGQSIDTANGVCVNTDECPNPCAVIDCEPNAVCKVDLETGEPFCEPLPDPCDRCPKGTFCDVSVIPCLIPPCPENVRCLTQEQVCSLPSENGPCRGFIPRYFHNKKTGQCEEFIYGGCGGNQNNFETKEECERACDVDPCASKICERGSVCTIFEPTGEAFCEPSCKIDNGGCREDQICELELVFCFRAPCPRRVQCRDPDPCDRCPKGTFCDVSPVIFCLIPPCPENVRCLTQEQVCSLPSETGLCRGFFPRYFHNKKTGQCEEFIYGGCGGNQNNFETKQECETTCGVDPCASKICERGSVCKIFEPTGEAFCEPSCKIDNGGCREDQICELELVLCVRAPCPQGVQCRDPDPCDSCPDGTFCEVTVFPCLVPPCPENVRCLTQEEVCALPPETGPCEAEIPRFFHNATSGQCEEFIYGGCEGNDNNYKTLEVCERACGVTDSDEPNACALVLCAPGTFCRIDQSTGEPVCEPQCDPECPSGQKCSLEPLICLNPPCALRPQCIPIEDDLCATKECEDGFRCQIFTPQFPEFSGGPQAFCNPDCNLNNGGCRPDQECQLLPRLCAVGFPCPFARLCIDRTEDLCATKECEEGFRCEIFTPLFPLFSGGPQAFCNPDCDLNNGGCRPDQECRLLPPLTPCAVDFPCPFNRVCIDRAEVSAAKTCPPTCSKEFCEARGNRRALCSNPGPREIPGCTGPCQLTYCHACYFSEEFIFPAPGNCDECTDVQDYTSDTTCYRRWANCVRRAHISENGRPSPKDKIEENFKCYSPPCPFKG